MRVNAICGFLGSGKTTLLQRILTARAGREPLAVIVNEFGEVGVDGAILSGHSVDMVELTAGCLCCTLKGSLVSALLELRDRKGVERVVIEATGVAQPGELEEVLRDPALGGVAALGPLVTVVDASRFTAFSRVLGPFYRDQVSRADVVLLNKTDLVDPEQLGAVRRAVETLNPRAAVFATQRCDVALEALLDGQAAPREPSALEQGLAAPAPGAGFVSFVVPADFDADRARLTGFFATLPPGVVRAKGFMRVEGQPATIQFAGGRLEILPAERPRSPSLVFISRDEPDREGIAARLRSTGR